MNAPTANQMLSGARPAGTDDDQVPHGERVPERGDMWSILFRRDPAPDQPKIKRDRWRRPAVVPPGTRRPTYYSSPSTVAKTLSDVEKLHEWEIRQVLIGASLRPDLMDLVVAHRDDRNELDDLAKRAKEAAATEKGANRGTALHRVTEKVDFGIPTGPLPTTMRRDVDAYVAVTAGLAAVLSEVFCVHDGHKLGGSFDRVVEYQGRYFVVDIKTGGLEFSEGEYAIQTAIYSRAMAYDWKLAQHLLDLNKLSELATADLRCPLPGPLDQDRAIIVHLPVGTGTAQLYWIDIARGWDAAERSMWTRAWRRKSTRDQLLTPFTPVAPPTVLDTGRRPERSDESVARVATLAGGAVRYSNFGTDARPLRTVELPPEQAAAPVATATPEQDAVQMAAAVQAVARAGGVTEIDETDPTHPAAKITAALRAATDVDGLLAVWRAHGKGPHWDATHTTLGKVLRAKFEAQEAHEQATRAARNGETPS